MMLSHGLKPPSPASWAPQKAPLAMPMMARLENSAEHGRKVLETRLLDDITELDTWFFRGQCTMTFPDRGQMRHVGAGGNINGLQPATGRNSSLPAATLRRAFAGEDWTRYNRLSFWIRPSRAVEMCVIGGANSPQRRSRPKRQFPSPADPPRGCWSGERTCVFPAPSPWVGVVVPDGDLGRLKEVIGVGARVPRSQAARDSLPTVGTLKCLEAL